jgi:hypothetical protein
VKLIATNIPSHWEVGPTAVTLHHARGLAFDHSSGN